MQEISPFLCLTGNDGNKEQNGLDMIYSKNKSWASMKHKVFTWNNTFNSSAVLCVKASTSTYAAHCVQFTLAHTHHRALPVKCVSAN